MRFPKMSGIASEMEFGLNNSNHKSAYTCNVIYRVQHEVEGADIPGDLVVYSNKSRVQLPQCNCNGLMSLDDISCGKDVLWPDFMLSFQFMLARTKVCIDANAGRTLQ